jgi:hypothetical protein
MIRMAAGSVMAGAITLLVGGAASAAPMLGQVDTFQDGTTGGWTVALLGEAHPLPPLNEGGGKEGPDDRYLLLTSHGAVGPGSKLSAANLEPRWTGNYLAAGITAITMDVINFGPTDLYLRFGFEDPTTGPPENIAFSDAAYLPAGSGWTRIQFLVGPSHLTAALGSVAAALSNTTAVRLYHSDIPNFPNPFQPVPAIMAQLGVDNIQATRVPEPVTTTLFGLALAAVAARRRALG